MRFRYKYQGKDGHEQEDVLSAASLDAAYSCLRKSGVRPMKVWPEPGIVNRLMIGKRWVAIIVLGIVAAISTSVLILDRHREATGAVGGNVAQPMSRRQIPEVSVGLELETDRVLAHFVRPGRLDGLDEIDLGGSFANFRDEVRVPILLSPDDSQDVVDFKRVLASVKEEARVAILSKENPKRLIARLIERQRMEADYRTSVVRRVREGVIGLAPANASLRLMGLAETTEEECHPME